MSANTDMVPQTKTRAIVESFVNDPARVNLDSLVMLNQITRSERDALLELREVYDGVLDAQEDAKRKAILHEQRQRREQAYEQFVAPLDAVGRQLESSFFRTLKKRMDEKGLNSLEVPDPVIKIRLDADYGKYQPDVESLALIAKDLPKADADKLVTITPAVAVEERTFSVPLKELARALEGVPADTVITVTVAAHTRPETKIAGNSVAIMKIAEKNTGSAIEVAIRAAMPRPRNKDRLTIGLHDVAQPMKTVVPA